MVGVSSSSAPVRRCRCPLHLSAGSVVAHPTHHPTSRGLASPGSPFIAAEPVVGKQGAPRSGARAAVALRGVMELRPSPCLGGWMPANAAPATANGAAPCLPPAIESHLLRPRGAVDPDVSRPSETTARYSWKCSQVGRSLLLKQIGWGRLNATHFQAPCSHGKVCSRGGRCCNVMPIAEVLNIWDRLATQCTVKEETKDDKTRC